MDLKVLYDLLKEVREDIKDIKDTQAEHSEELVKYNIFFESIKEDIEQNTSDLSEHIKRTQINEEQLSILKDQLNKESKRIDELEMPNKIREWLSNRYTKTLGLFSVIATGVAAIGRALHWW